jgi:hypothetical protein
MVPATQDEFERYRIVVFSQDGKDVLLIADGNRFGLPFVEVSRWQRVAENLTEAVRRDWGEEVVCLFEPSGLPGTDSGIHYEAAERWRATGVPKRPTSWVPVQVLSERSFTDVSDYLAIQHSRAQWSTDGKTLPDGPFTAPSWFKGLYEWVEGVVEPLGLHLTGSFRQLNASPSFSLIRFETDGPALWFKAAGEPNQREFPITQTLSKRFSDYVAPLIAVRTEWNGWLTREIEGINLSETQEPTLWAEAAARLAELQVASIGHDQEILSAGAHDLSFASLSELVLPFSVTVATLMDQQGKIPPRVLTRAELARMGRVVLDSLDVLQEVGLPDTLGHLDLNPGNILVSRQACIFLDWAEAYVGLPFLSLQYLVEHLRRTAVGNLPVEVQVVEAYTAAWQRTLSPDVLSQGLEFAPLLAVFAYAAASPGWRHPETLQPAAAAYLRSLTRRMYREANQLEERRSLCVH